MHITQSLSQSQTIYSFSKLSFKHFPNQNWSDSKEVLALVQNDLSGLDTVSSTDSHITLASWNTEYLWQAKANYFIDTYAEIISKHHILALQEVSQWGLAVLSQSSDYQYIVSESNNRGQALGFLIHPRLTVTAIHEYSELTNILGAPNLRPALRVDLLDTKSGLTLSVVTVHLKSMIGGLEFTGRIRQEQIKQLIWALDNIKTPILIMGDFNCFLDKSFDTARLFNNGFRIANRTNHVSTQCFGGRLDGLFYRDFPSNGTPKHYSVRNFWQHNSAGRSLSDHGLLTWKLLQ